MIDLNKIVNNSMKEIESEGFVEKVVKKTLEKTIESVIDDTFRSWSEFGKNLEKHIQENLNVNFEELKIDTYNTLVLAAVQEKLDLSLKIQGIEKIKEAMDKMLKDVEKEYKLSELIKEVKGEDYKEEYEHDEDDQITLIIDDNASFKYIYFDKDDDKSKWNCKYKITIYKDKIHSLKIDDKELDKKTIMSGFHGLGDTLFKIYAAGAIIILDEGNDPEDYDLYYRSDDY